MKQLDLDGYQVAYQCRKCSRCFNTMKEQSRHHLTKHRNNLITKVSINFALENYKMISTKEIVKIA